MKIKDKEKRSDSYKQYIKTKVLEKEKLIRDVYNYTIRLASVFAVGYFRGFINDSLESYLPYDNFNQILNKKIDDTSEQNFFDQTSKTEFYKLINEQIELFIKNVGDTLKKSKFINDQKIAAAILNIATLFKKHTTNIDYIANYHETLPMICKDLPIRK